MQNATIKNRPYIFLGFYRYPVVNKYSAHIEYKQLIMGQENTAVLTIDCNNDVEITVIVYASLMHHNNYTLLTDTPISVPNEIELTTKWIAKYPGPNYLEFKIKEGGNNYVTTGGWYHVLGEVKHEIQVRESN
jgi:hypothetical protein